MQDLERRVTGDWYDVREAARDAESLAGYFKIPEDQLKTQIEKLEFALEQGVVEYKRSSLAPLFNMLENARFSSPAFDVLKKQLGFTGALLFVMLVEKQYADGALKIAHEKRQAQGVAPEALDLKEILKDINSRIKQAPDSAKNPLIKNLLLQASQLRAERENMQKLLPTIKAESRETFLQNYQKTFAGYVEKIKRNYAALIGEELPQVEGPRPILELVDLGAVAENLAAQCEAVSRLRSTVAFVIEGKYKIRDILLGLANRKAPLLALLTRETALYVKMESAVAPGRLEGDGSTARAFCREIIRYLERQLAHSGAR